MGIAERAADLAADVGDQLWPWRPRGPPQRTHGLGQIVSRDMLHRDEELTVDRTELEHLNDVRMVEPGRHLGFLDEHPDESRIVGEAGQDALHDEDALESRGAPGASLEDVGHTAAPNPLEERVLAELNRLFELLGHVRSRVRGRSRPIPPACESSAPGTSSVVSEDS